MRLSRGQSPLDRWRGRDRPVARLRHGGSEHRFGQISVCSEISSASSTSMPTWRTVLSSFELPSSSCTAHRFLALALLWRVQQGFLDAALHAVDTDHGGIEKYLRGCLG